MNRRAPGSPPRRRQLLVVAAVIALLASTAVVAAGQEAAAPPDPYDVVEVVASGTDGNLPEATLDGDLSTRWSAETTDEANPQWIRYDLGEPQDVGYLGIAWHQGDQRQGFFEVEVSDDGQNWTTVLSDGASSGGDLDLEPVVFDTAGPETGVTARFVRYVGYGNTNSGWNSLTEVRVYPPNDEGAVVESFADQVPEPDPDAEPYTTPGLTEADGSPHGLPEPNPVTGDTLDVTAFGAVADDGEDDAAAINAAITAADRGDEVYLPGGVYDLVSGVPGDAGSNVALRSGINLRGAGQDDTVLRSHFDGEGRVVRGYGVTDLVVSDLTVTSTFDGEFSEDHRDNDAGGGPQYGIFFSDAVTRPSQRVYVDGVTVERYQRMGVRIESSQDVVVQNALFRDATSVGGGGAGYGVSIQGTAKQDRLGFPDDSRHNVVRDSHFQGPHLRHGVLLQFYTHNNLVADNSFDDLVLDAVDLHGEDEYLNEVRGNRFTDSRAAAIALGNTGGTAPSNHDAAGPGNWIHHNQISGAAREGIKVHLGSPDTVIEHNVIRKLDGPTNARGIQVMNAPGTVVRDNTIVDNRAEGFWAIHLAPDPGDAGAGGVGRGVPTDVTITGNKIMRNAGGLLLEAGQDTTITDNKLQNNGEDIRLDTAEPPPPPEEPPPPAGDVVLSPTDDSMIDNGAPDTTFGSATLLKWKQNGSGSIQRLVYYRFEVEDPDSVSQATLELSAKLNSSTSTSPPFTFSVLASPDAEWDEGTLSWDNAPIQTAADADTAATFTMDAPFDQVQRIQVDVTDAVRAADGAITFVVMDPDGQDANVDSYSKERGSESLRPVLSIDR